MAIALARSKGTWRKQRALFREALRLKPDYAEAHNNLGIALQEQGQLAAAVAQYQEAIRLKPDYAEAHNNLGNALQEQGQLAAAVTQYQEALRLKPDYAEAHWNRALTWLLAGDFKQGWPEYRMAPGRPSKCAVSGPPSPSLFGMARL